MQYKKKAGQELHKWQKEFNTWMSSLRVVVENAIGGAKRLRILNPRILSQKI